MTCWPTSRPIQSWRERRKFLEHCKMPKFDARLQQPTKQHRALAEDVLSHVQVWCEDQGSYAVPAMLELVEDPASDLITRRGAVRALNYMLVDPFIYTYSREPREDETPACWRAGEPGGQRRKNDFEPRLRRAPQRAETQLQAARHRDFAGQGHASAWSSSARATRRFSPRSCWATPAWPKRASRALALRLYLGKPLRSDVPPDADAKLVDEVADELAALRRSPAGRTCSPVSSGKLWRRRGRHAIRPFGVAAGAVRLRPLGAENARAGGRQDLAARSRFPRR